VSQPIHDSERADLRDGALVASFLPSCGMLGVSLQHDGREFVALPRSVDDHRHGATTGIPLLHPWANRLRSHTYAVGDRVVDLTGLGVPTDGNGLPIHGVLHGRAFTVVEHTATRLIARADVTEWPDVLTAFPFPHTVTIECRLDADTIDSGTLTVATELHNTGDTALPVSFGWHPFFTLPGTPRSQWRLRTPVCERHVLTAQLLPTGATVPMPGLDAPIGDRTYDDHFTLGPSSDDGGHTFVVADADHTLTVRFDDHYPAAQLYLPPSVGASNDFVCIEPMTAATDAINAGTAPMLAAGDRFRAEWSVSVERT
jgi:galactose mutarotase-like enzyme